MAFRWRADDGPGNIECWLGQLCDFFSGSGPALLRTLYFVIFQGVWTPCHPLRIQHDIQIRNTYSIFKSDISRHRSEGRVLIDARSSIILVRRVVPARSGNSVISLASESSLNEKQKKVSNHSLYKISCLF